MVILCIEENCNSTVQYYDGGIMGKCAKHGGKPKCSKNKC